MAVGSVVPIRRALLSVSDKTGLIDFATGLVQSGVELLASGGTRTALIEAGLPVDEVSTYTGQPEILGGRVKTLHPKIHAGILARRDDPADLETLQTQGFPTIDLVVVNLYPFEQTIARPEVTDSEAIETIDIGGPSLIRGAAKNHAHVAVVTDPSQYSAVLNQIQTQGGTDEALRSQLAVAVFRLCAHYDATIAHYLGRDDSEPFPETLTLSLRRRDMLRYGENPHQRAAFYIDPQPTLPTGANLATARQIQGKELSYNNLLDLDSALRLIRNFERPAACVLKHNNPCGAAEASTLVEAFAKAYEGDPISAFGGIVGLNRPVDVETAEAMAEPGRFLEAILAPEFIDKAVEILTTKPSWKASVRLLSLDAPVGPDSPAPQGADLRRVEGGLLVQDFDAIDHETLADLDRLEVKSRRRPTPEEFGALRFAWSVCQAVRSNAIVLAHGFQVVGVGAGQMSRLDSVRIAVTKAGPKARGAVLASDAFFPFRDGPDQAAEAGVTALIQPGGSKRDDETIAACDEHGLALVFTGRRHFRH